MNIGVIGSGGFLSKILVEGLDYSTLTIYGRANSNNSELINFKRLDILNSESGHFNDFLSHDVLIFCAAMGVQSGTTDNVENLLTVNYLYPVRLIDYLNKNKFRGKIITFGSYFEIGQSDRHELVSEEDIISMRTQVPNIYCISKRNLTNFLSTFETNLDIFHLILPTIFGHGESNNRLIPYLISSLKSNNNINLTSGEQTRQYLYIHDLVNLIQNFILKGHLEKGIYNLGGDIIKVKDLVKIIQEYYFNSTSRLYFENIERLDSKMSFLGLCDKKLIEQIGQYRTTSIYTDLEKIINEYAV
ncbi:MAG: NAD-dependent epimerase/dehydratase family protein [Spirosomataceae bacterium]